MSSAPTQPLSSRLLGTAVVVALGTLLTATYFQTCFSSRQLGANFVSPSTWYALTRSATSTTSVPQDPHFVSLPMSFTLVPCAIVSMVAWLAGSAGLVILRRMNWREAVVRWGWYGWLWWCLVDLWEWMWILAGATGLSSLTAILSVTPQFWLAGCLAGWMTTWFTLNESLPADRRPLASSGSHKWLWFACGLYVIVFTTMNWRLYFNLLIPHGDSAMYEEHLWNLLHGKGFRSYLDRGLFLGEHIQFVHLFLLPVYILWPSHLLLEACSSLALALGAFPVYWMTRRHTGSDRVAFAVAVAYLLYFPMQFLDIEIDLKTFRPESFGIPLLLLTLDQVDRKSLRGTVIGVALCLTVKEDYTLIFGPLGLWIASASIRFRPRQPLQGGVSETGQPSFDPPEFRSPILTGLSLSAFSVVYLWLATRVVMPWFRSGVEVHYASYFSRFGKTPEEILMTWFTRPGSVAETLLTPDTALYALALLAPLAFLPVLAPSRLAVGLPLFAILCMNELEGSRTPQHQFHAPLVAILFWGLAAAIPVASSLLSKMASRLGGASVPETAGPLNVIGRLVWTSSFATGIFFSLGPLSMPFWDSGSSWNWWKLYGPTHRAAMYSRIENAIPVSSRVASTDFVHPRFTHFDRSYDYSDYHREVSGEGKRIPDDTQYIVIDTDHKYSKIKRPDQISEFRDHPESWDLIPDKTEGLFIILKRKPQNFVEPQNEE